MTTLQSFFRNAFVLCVIAVLTALPLSAHEVAGPSPSAGLGALVFPTSARIPEAQKTFERAALLLHLFEYDEAAETFRKAQALEPDFVMAVWGEAMTHNHPLWNQLDQQAGTAALRKLGDKPSERLAKAHTPREKAYLSAVEILYSGVGSKVERDASYEVAMSKMAANFPNDNQAQLFHALALQGRSQGVRDVADYLRAAEISRRIFDRNPQNPGAAHYWIHGMDDPEHASGAIEAARALAKIAPDAGHAQHMTSHIFIALGLWDDLVQANVEASRVVDAQSRASGKPEVRCFHYNEWLEYGYYQQGRIREANQLLLKCKRSGDAGIKATKGKEGADKLALRFSRSLPAMRATAVIESRDWSGPAVQLQVPDSTVGYAAAVTEFSTGYAAAQRGDLVAAKIALAALAKRVATAQPDSEDLQAVDYLNILHDDLAGLIVSKRGEFDQALTLVRGAAARLDAMAFDFGPPVPVKPPHELLGELLLAANKPAEAAEAFTRSLELAPMRAQSLLGLARAQVLNNENTDAAATYAKVIDMWHQADTDLPELAEARRFVNEHAKNAVLPSGTGKALQTESQESLQARVNSTFRAM